METTTEIQRILVQDIEKLANNAHHSNNQYIVERIKNNTLKDFKCIYEILEIPENYFLSISAVKNSNFSMFNRYEQKSTGTLYDQSQMNDYMKKMPKVELLVKNFPTEAKKDQQYHYHNSIVNVLIDDKLKVSYPYSYYGGAQYPVTLFKNDKGHFIRTLGCDFDLINIVKENTNYSFDQKMSDIDKKLYVMINSWNMLENFKLKDVSRETMNELFKKFSGINELPITNTEGITKTLVTVQSFYNQLVEKDFISALAVKLVADSCKSTVGGIKYSTVFNKLFANTDTFEKFSEKALEISQLYVTNVRYLTYDKTNFLKAVLDTLSEAREMKKAVLKRKSTGAFNKIMDDIEFIQIDKDKYPLSYAAITNGEIPTSTFFRKSGESYFIYNDNWDIWEEILKEHKEVAVSIASEASKRTTYEKDIMSYFYFVLHGLPEYLEKNTGKKWKGIPKLVNSANELDPPTEGSNGVAKTRSALTPIVDNENSTVVVPYVSMQIGGYQTTYCYGLNYSVLQRGFSFLGNTVSKDVEENLNGRDNYGLMFYTLTGTAQGRGYPTFLIIFENMDKEKYGQNFRVHFHRTHPMRSKGGDYNPIHNWTKGCYKWMIGNVNYERIVAQQGDLAFVQIDTLPEGEMTTVNAYDNHCFSEPVNFVPYLKKEKQNILGYVELTKNVTLNHNEHLNREIPKGIYEIRQCRSWEANPKGIWSLRID